MDVTVLPIEIYAMICERIQPDDVLTFNALRRVSRDISQLVADRAADARRKKCINSALEFIENNQHFTVDQARKLGSAGRQCLIEKCTSIYWYGRNRDLTISMGGIHCTMTLDDECAHIISDWADNDVWETDINDGHTVGQRLENAMCSLHSSMAEDTKILKIIHKLCAKDPPAKEMFEKWFGTGVRDA